MQGRTRVHVASDATIKTLFDIKYDLLLIG